jgi:hypothetical protein
VAEMVAQCLEADAPVDSFRTTTHSEVGRRAPKRQADGGAPVPVAKSPLRYQLKRGAMGCSHRLSFPNKRDTCDGKASRCAGVRLFRARCFH